MTYDAWEECRLHLETYDDEQLLAAWDESVRRDRADPEGMARLQLWDSVRFGRYCDMRRAEAQIQRRPRARVYPVGRALAAERVRARFTQHGLAAAARMSRDAIARIEREIRLMSFDEACRLSDVLRVPLERSRPIE